MKIAKNVYTLICDDVRTESNDKISLMGVLRQDLYVDELPTILPTLAFMVIFEGFNTDIKEFKIVVTVGKEKPALMQFKADKENNVHKDLKIIGHLVPFIIEKEGTVKIQLSSPQLKKVKTIHSFKIIKEDPLD